MALKFRMALAAALVFASGAALAQDYSGMTCEELWMRRNGIYKDAGYCFKTARAIRVFGNAGCQYDAMGAVPLSGADQAAIARIQQWEGFKGCPR